jgi:hypothetical protein
MYTNRRWRTFYFILLNIDVTTANSEMTSSIFTKLMNPDNKTDIKDVCNYLRVDLKFFSVHEEINVDQSL